MGDLRIYDSQGNPAPFLVRGVKGTVTIPPEKEVPLLVWDEKSGRFTSPELEITVSGSAVTILSGGAGERDGSGALYLADLSDIKEDDPWPSKLVLDFQQTEFFNAPLLLRKSDDLSRWENYGPIQTAAFYNNPGTDRNEFNIPRARYILLDFNGKVPPVHSARIRFNPVENPPVLRETVFSGTRGADGKTVRYYTEGYFPVQKLFFSISKPDSIGFSIRDRRTENDDWRYAGKATVYRIEAPGEAPLINGPIDVSGQGPYWELAISGEQTWTEVPAMAFLWEPREIVFLARGGGPWTLAYGNGKYGPQESSLNIQEGTEIFPARLGPASYVEPESGGMAGTERWRQIILWGVLGLAAVVVSGLAFYAIRSISSEQKNNMEDKP
jgi:hypothetical protein